ncbi:MAG: 4-hydroxythreonine-4-phosphate dehydrogenase PdxA [Candidatus Omnitrophota bacterium]
MLGITIGDPGGIGPEITLKALTRLKIPANLDVVIFGDKPVLKRTRLPIPKRITVISTGAIKNGSFPKGKPDPVTGGAAYSYLQDAITSLKRGEIKALVTAPVAKEAINLAGIKFSGHTELLAESFDVQNYGMLFIARDLRLLLLTTHLPLFEVFTKLDKNVIIRKVELGWSFLKNRLAIKKPKVLICGLNPHAGEGGYLGKEEETIFQPALKYLERKGINVTGPIAADTAFRIYRQGGFHLIVSPYHDQLLPLFKGLYFNQGVNLTIGLPFIRTSPDHGTAFDLAYRNKADSSSMLAAVKLALRLSK